MSPSSSVFLFASLVFMVASVYSQSADYPSCSLSDAVTLQGFYKSVHASKLLWPNHINCCSWIGIACNSYGRVVSVHLPSFNLSGSIPSILFDLSALETLNLSRNFLSGRIPQNIANLSSLSTLDLSYNSFEGPFPQAIIECASLSFISLSGNMLTGDIPAALQSLRHLKTLLLRSNFFSGVVPLDRRFLNQLQVFDASNNKLVAWDIDQVSQLTEARAVLQNEVLQKECARYHSQSLHAHGFPSFSVHRGRHLLQNNQRSEGGSKLSVPVIIGVLAGVGVFLSILLVVGVVVLCRMKVRLWRRNRSVRLPPRLSGLKTFRRESSRVFDPTLASISMRDLVKATDDFDFRRVVGDGGFGLVYCATLQDGRTVAVKKLSTDGMQGKREFEAEMETLGKIKHRNLVELLAYCKVGDDRVLVYEFVENGSLDTWLHEKVDGPALLFWERRVKIACCAARGLSYLHYDCNPHVLHRDIKSSNILLDKDFEAKIADFGLARTMSPQYSHVSTEAAGTLGYMAPEFSLTLNATKQADVYSFGMVMLELASGRRPNLLLQDNSFRKLAQWARHMLHLGHEMDVLDPVFKKNPPPPDQVRAYFAVACDCVSERPKDRPKMREIHERLSLIGLEQHD